MGHFRSFRTYTSDLATHMASTPRSTVPINFIQEVLEKDYFVNAIADMDIAGKQPYVLPAPRGISKW